MGFSKYGKHRNRDKLIIYVRKTGFSILSIPQSVLAAIGSPAKADVFLGADEDAGSIGIRAGSDYSLRKNGNAGTMMCACHAAIKAACAGAEPVSRPRYEIRDNMLIVWPGQPAPEEVLDGD